MLRETTTLRDDDQACPAPEERSALALRVVFSPDSLALGRVFELHPDGLLPIGRDAEPGLKLVDQRVSRLHARIVWDPQRANHVCADAGSANGTFINGLRAAKASITRSDVIRLGDTLLVCEQASCERSEQVEQQRAAQSDLPVLILGETGTGKELLARRVHEASGRQGPLVPVNCAALPTELWATELFGHRRGAFSGALAERLGVFRSAANGSVFLDEVGDLPPAIQAAMLRVLQERTVRPLGSDREESIDFRIIAATHRDLEQDVLQGVFREDLFARLAHVVLQVAPLRARRGRILELFREFAPALALTPGAAEVLLLGEWPRNVRELRAVAQALAATLPGGATVTPRELAARLPQAAALVSARTAQSVCRSSHPPASDQREHLQQLLREHRGSVAGVARALGKPRSHVYRWLRNFGLSTERFRQS